MKLCPSCNNNFTPSSRHVNCPTCRRLKRKKKCPKCGKLILFESNVCLKCHNGSGENNPNWKGGKTVHRGGYLAILVARHKYKFEHILVMEKHLKRKLFKNENVHHLNGVRDDNRIENLELWVRPQPTGIRATDAVIWAKEIIKRYSKS